MVGAKEKFGSFIRRERQFKGIGLRVMAKKMGITCVTDSTLPPDHATKEAADEEKDLSQLLDDLEELDEEEGHHLLGDNQ